MQSLKILQVSAVRMMQRESQYHIFRCACTGRHSIDDPLPGMTFTEITQVISLTWLVEFRIAKKKSTRCTCCPSNLFGAKTHYV